ncbi:hypothetical protein HAPAU_08900 [Halalkalicoccus paucihalophilus]|jgi:hypothetical protein|uniref:RING-type domain-containing protein n=1 Tax=Halalkalicoccus paucihalophilus TaxID=1008153 RepID=A0A151AHG5_9EURY|nr:hypothetical protein [Halalkalicoccus paucihalophilus]KYH27002.1 hypothetical protein HAPAU_08900 [Halalkalicoccus paucihalophilus]
MGTRCTLCRHRFPDYTLQEWCECGWCMDENCKRNHEPFCPAHGEDRWIGTVEF